ncbi:MAG: hypothetical protein WAX80_03730 [Minisyncoccia bacterium]
MKTGKALVMALLVTVVSAILLTLLHGTPTLAQLWEGGLPTMFAVAFVVFKFFAKS